jgi:hypothetical protein
MSDNLMLVTIEPVAMAIRTCRHMTGDDGVAALANLEIPRCLNDFLRPSGAVGKMAFRHAHAIPDSSSCLNGVPRAGQFFGLRSLTGSGFEVHR